MKSHIKSISTFPKDTTRHRWDICTSMTTPERTAARLAQDPRRVALVDHHQGVVLLRERQDLGERCHVAVHAEDAVRDLEKHGERV